MIPEGYKKSKIGQIPESWTSVQICEIATEDKSNNTKASEPVVLSCTKHNGFVASLDYFKKQIFSKDLSKYKIVKKYQFGYATNHIEEGSIGYQNKYDIGLVSPMYTVFSTNKSKIDDYYLYSLLKSDDYVQIYKSKTNATVDRRGSLRWSSFSKIDIPLPPLTEQRKIAEVLTAVDDAIANTDAIIKETQELKKGLTQKLFTEGIGHYRFKDTKIGRIPESWDVVRLVEHLTIPNGQVDPREEKYQSLPLVAPNHIETNSGRLLELASTASQNPISGKFLFEPGSVLYSKIRPHLRKALIVDFEGLCSADMYPLKPEKTLNARFLLTIILGDDFSDHAISRSMRTGIPKLNRKELAEYKCALPPLPEQEEIAAILSEIDSKLQNEQATKAELEQLKKGLSQVLLTGKVRVKV